MEHLLDIFANFSGPMAYLLVFGVLIACGLGIPIPEDLSLIAGGYICHLGQADPWGMILTGFLGVMVGDSVIFYLGRKFGRSLLRLKFFSKILSPEKLAQVEKKLNSKGTKLIFAARFMPGLRAPMYFTCGTLKVPYRVFAFYDGGAALISVPAIVYSAYYFGSELDWVISIVRKVENGILVAVLAILLFVLYKMFKNRKMSGSARMWTGMIFTLVALQVFTVFGGSTAQAIDETPATAETFCSALDASIKSYRWDLKPCDPKDYQVLGKSAEGRPLVVAEFPAKGSENATMVLSMVHGDEITPLYLALKMIEWFKDHKNEQHGKTIVVAPLVNPDGYYRNPKTRVNARGVDVNRNLPTQDWNDKALQAWKRKFRSDKRRFPGHNSNSEPETQFQVQLIEKYQPSKILSIHAPLGHLDYDGPNALTLSRFPKEYVAKCLQLRSQLKAKSSGFYPGSLGNYAGQERGIPTITLELESASPKKALSYWKDFELGIRKVVEFELLPQVADLQK